MFSDDFGSVNQTFVGASCSTAGDHHFCVAVGQTNDGTFTPIVYVNTNITATTLDNWTAANLNPSDLSVNLFSVSCAPNNNGSFCAAVGNDDGGNMAIITSTDNGQNWSEFALSSSQPTFLNAISCTNNVSTVICTASGMTFDLTSFTLAPIVYVNLDAAGTGTWEQPAGLTLPASGCLTDAGTNGQSFGGYLSELSCILD